MLQTKIDELFSHIINVFDMSADILIKGFDGGVRTMMKH